MAAPAYYDRKADYARLWASMEVRASKAADINATADRIVSNKERYQAVEQATKTPWYVIGLIHAMEGGCNFKTHLHNGDSLARRTVQVPAGRPKTGSPPFQWQDSAIDAIRYDGLDKVQGWSIERICYELEKFNGWGYAQHHADVNTPYLWSGTNQYARGKYVQDGVWSSSAVSGQSGAMPILKRIMELYSDVRPALSTEEPEPVEETVASPALAFPKAVPEGGAAGSVAGAVAATVTANDNNKPALMDRLAPNAAKVEELAGQGSRVATALRSFKAAIWKFFGTSTVLGGGAATLIDPNKGSAAVVGSWASQHPFLIAALCVGATALVIGAAAYWYAKKIEKGLVSAANDGRYTTRGAPA